MKWWIVVFALSLCPVCKTAFDYRAEIGGRNGTSIFQGDDDVAWYGQYQLTRCLHCNAAFYVLPDTITRFAEKYKVLDTVGVGKVSKFYYSIDTTIVPNPKWVKK